MNDTASTAASSREAASTASSSEAGSRGPVRIGLAGTGWRADFFHRVARARPDLFTLDTVWTRSDDSAARARDRWHVDVHTDWDAFTARGPFDYVIVSVPRSAAPDLTCRLVEAGTPALVETPPATDVAAMQELYRRLGASAPVQIAEQYQYQPHHAARIALARSGLIGPVGSARVSVAHGYHGVNLIRRLLDVGLDAVEIEATAFPDPVVSPRDRGGWINEPQTVTATTTLATLRFDQRVGVFEFDDQQYFAPYRSRHLWVRGEKGEIVDDEVTYLARPGLVAHERLRRDQGGFEGDLTGNHLNRLVLGDRVVYTNPMAPAALADDEIAIGDLMARMAVFVAGGEGFYGLAEACHDHYLGLLIDEAAGSRRRVRSEQQPWMAGRGSS